MHVADARGDVNPAVVIRIESGEEPFVAHRGPRRAQPGQKNLPAVGVAAEEQIPGMELEKVLCVRIVGEDDARGGAVHVRRESGGLD